jgi:hypothetical protein
MFGFATEERHEVLAQVSDSMHQDSVIWYMMEACMHAEEAQEVWSKLQSQFQSLKHNNQPKVSCLSHQGNRCTAFIARKGNQLHEIYFVLPFLLVN